MSKGKKILIIDDDRSIVTVLTYILTEENYIVLTAETGEEALTLYKENHPDLVLLDYMLPDINGDVVAQKIKAENSEKTVPIVLISAAHNASDIAQAAKLEGYIPKPFEIDTLLEQIRTYLP